MQATVTAYQFGNFTLDVIHKKLVQNDTQQTIELGERQFLLLRLLCDASPDSVHKVYLTEKLWPKTRVSDWSLSRLVSDTRQILKDDGDNQEIIKTVRGIGFLMNDVVHLDSYTSPVKPKKNWKKKGMLALLVSCVLITSVIVFEHLKKQNEHQQLVSALSQIAEYQDNAYTAFVAQIKRRNELVGLLEARLGITREQQFEKLFVTYHDQFNQEEAFVCAQMRAITETGLMENNRNIVNTLSEHPIIFDYFADAKVLQQHLIFWLNKYDSVFRQREDMCLVYVGVEDNVPYPSGIDQKIKDWLKAQNTN